jgi:hypothetical protein
MRFGDGLPTPETMALALTADASPALRLEVAFGNEADALKMEHAWPDVLRRYRTVTAYLGLSTALDDLKLTRTGPRLALDGHIAAPQMTLALSWAVRLLPHPRVDGGVPPH